MKLSIRKHYEKIHLGLCSIEKKKIYNEEIKNHYVTSWYVRCREVFGVLPQAPGNGHWVWNIWWLAQKSSCSFRIAIEISIVQKKGKKKKTHTVKDRDALVSIPHPLLLIFILLVAWCPSCCCCCCCCCCCWCWWCWWCYGVVVWQWYRGPNDGVTIIWVPLFENLLTIVISIIKTKNNKKKHSPRPKRRETRRLGPLSSLSPVLNHTVPVENP